MSPDSTSRTPLARWRGVWFRVVAVAVGLAPFVVGEAVLRIGGWGKLSDAHDPYIGLAAVHPLFELSRDGERYEIPQSRQTFFCPESFSADKPSNGFRIFCLGGSTVQGRPFTIETSFPRWLELSLRAADPSREWDVVNCGGVSYASYRLTPVLAELLDYEPDMVVLYTGHNEFLEDRTYRAAKRAPRWLARTHGTLSSLRTYNLIRSWWVGVEAPVDRPVLSAEVDALLDYKGGLEDYRRDDAWRRGTVEHFEFNVRTMIRMATDAGVPVVLVNPVSDLSNTPPFKATHREGITESERARFMAYWDAARSLDASVDQRITALKNAIGIDGRHALVQFHLGRLYEQRGQLEMARAAYLRAKDEDVCPLRMLESMHEVVRVVARETAATLLDARRLLDGSAGTILPGEKWLIDHVHPTILGHQHIAAGLLSHLTQRGLVVPVRGAPSRRHRRYLEHFEALAPDYYIRGRQRLDGLERWSSGRALGVKGREK
jgi:lysophospholipase L1-like esterase